LLLLSVQPHLLLPSETTPQAILLPFLLPFLLLLLLLLSVQPHPLLPSETTPQAILSPLGDCLRGNGNAVAAPIVVDAPRVLTAEMNRDGSRGADRRAVLFTDSARETRYVCGYKGWEGLLRET
jgi:hypothetical protein